MQKKVTKKTLRRKVIQMQNRSKGTLNWSQALQAVKKQEESDG